ncbi:MAG: hypothetical protein ACK5MD_03330 [Flavobacteriales bacterium]
MLGKITVTILFLDEYENTIIKTVVFNQVEKPTINDFSVTKNHFGIINYTMYYYAFQVKGNSTTISNIKIYDHNGAVKFNQDYTVTDNKEGKINDSGSETYFRNNMGSQYWKIEVTDAVGNQTVDVKFLQW